MATLQELVNELQQIKTTAEELSTMVSFASESLRQHSQQIVQLTQPSQSGRDAAQAVGIAGQALANAAVSMRTLSRTCDNYLRSIQK